MQSREAPGVERAIRYIKAWRDLFGEDEELRQKITGGAVAFYRPVDSAWLRKFLYGAVDWEKFGRHAETCAPSTWRNVHSMATALHAILLEAAAEKLRKGEPPEAGAGVEKVHGEILELARQRGGEIRP